MNALVVAVSDNVASLNRRAILDRNRIQFKIGLQSLQLEDGQVSHGIALLVTALGSQVLLQDGDIVRVVSVDTVDKGLDDLGAGRGSVGDADHGERTDVMMQSRLGPKNLATRCTC